MIDPLVRQFGGRSPDGSICTLGTTYGELKN
jgi:hypothetical protein